MQIGVSSQNFRTITGHAGKGRRFLLFSGDDAAQLQEVARLDLPLEMSMHAWHGQGEHPLFQLDYLITAGCGTGFIRKLQQRGVQVKITTETTPLAAAQQLMQGILPELAPHT